MLRLLAWEGAMWDLTFVCHCSVVLGSRTSNRRPATSRMLRALDACVLARKLFFWASGMVAVRFETLQAQHIEDIAFAASPCTLDARAASLLIAFVMHLPSLCSHRKLCYVTCTGTTLGGTRVSHWRFLRATTHAQAPSVRTSMSMNACWYAATTSGTCTWRDNQ
jgi:hypothetical protein